MSPHLGGSNQSWPSGTLEQSQSHSSALLSLGLLTIQRQHCQSIYLIFCLINCSSTACKDGAAPLWSFDFKTLHHPTNTRFSSTACLCVCQLHFFLCVCYSRACGSANRPSCQPILTFFLLFNHLAAPVAPSLDLIVSILHLLLSRKDVVNPLLQHGLPKRVSSLSSCYHLALLLTSCISSRRSPIHLALPQPEH